MKALKTLLFSRPSLTFFILTGSGRRSRQFYIAEYKISVVCNGKTNAIGLGFQNFDF